MFRCFYIVNNNDGKPSSRGKLRYKKSFGIVDSSRFKNLSCLDCYVRVAVGDVIRRHFMKVFVKIILHCQFL